jgi:glutamate-5-semialdehyde dehydrogenase
MSDRIALERIPPGTPVIVGERVVPMPRLAKGDRLIPVHRTTDLLIVPETEYAAAEEAVARASAAFEQLAGATDDSISSFFESFASRLADESVWSVIAQANARDVERARAGGRSTTRLQASDKMRAAMIDGLRGWAKAPGRRGEVIERRDAGDWTMERRRAPLGVVAFVFEGRPNVFADGAGVVRGGNTSVMRIGSDALGTAIAIEDNALAPALAEAGLPDGTVTLLRSRSHASAHALFSMRMVRLAVARGSGRSVDLLGSIAEQHGIPASLHGTGGAWLYLADDATQEAAHNAVLHSIDRKVCNTLNVLLLPRVDALAKTALDALVERDPGIRLHVAPLARPYVPGEMFERKVLVRRAEGEVLEYQADDIGEADLGREWEWESTPEVSIAVVGDDEAAVRLINDLSPRLVASIITSDGSRFERFYERVDTPYVGSGFTRWVDGQWAWDRPELGLTNWERGRLLGRSGILSGEDVYTVRDVFIDRTGAAPQRR